MTEVATITIPPLVESTKCKILLIVATYVLTLALSTRIVTRFVPTSDSAQPAHGDGNEHSTEERRHLGKIIGKCENIIIVTFIFIQAETGLALIFAAKALVRREDIARDPGYFLGGTLLNFVWSLSVATIARTLIAGLQ